MISLVEILNKIFGPHYNIAETESVIFGHGKINDQSFHLLGVKESTSFGAQQALIMAERVLHILDSTSTDPVLLLVDVTGQQLSMRDEWIAMHQYFSHLLMCLECLRSQGNALISLIYNQAIGGAFIAYGLTADTILALPEAKVAVMWLDAMAKITKLDISELEQLSETSPVFAPGVKNFHQLGGITAIVKPDKVAGALLKAVSKRNTTDLRAQSGYERGGRKCAYLIIQNMLKQTL